MVLMIDHLEKESKEISGKGRWGEGIIHSLVVLIGLWNLLKMHHLIQLANPLGAPKGPPLSLREVNPFSED
jgi:hypothetical protein